jgi:hypothetical protein
MAITNNQFQKAEKSWNLKKLYKDLAQMKGKPLSDIEKLHLRGLLCGFSPAEIAEKRRGPNKKSLNKRGLEANLSNTLYQYIKKLVNKADQKLDNYQQVIQWLEEAGYKIESPNEFNNEDGISLDLVVNSLDINVNKAQINLKQNKLFVDINIRFIAPIEEDITEDEDMTENEDMTEKLEQNINENGYLPNNDIKEEYHN